MSSFDSELELPDMETIASLVENLVYRLPGCSSIMIRKTLQEVYRDFCRRSCCLLTPRRFDLRSGETRFAVPPEYEGELCVTEVRIGGRKLDEGLDYNVSGGFVFLNRRHTYGCDEAHPVKLHVLCVEVPRIGSEDAPVGFVQRYGDAICAGVLFRLMSMTGKPWSDQQQAIIKNAEYEHAVGCRRIEYHTRSDGGPCAPGYGFDASDLI